MFALYSAWYFWIPKILGLIYINSGGITHFWILFMGVNVTFFPQHFLGLQGMPRRISDYPDAFAGWNLISSLGSIISVVASFIFLVVLYAQLVKGKDTSRCPWLSSEFYVDILQNLLIRAFISIEWCLNSPPKPHPFVSLPVQSNIILLLDEQVMQSLWGYIDCFVQGTNSDEFFTISDEVSKDLFSSITELKVCTDQDLISSTFNDLDSTSVNEEILEFLDQTGKTYYTDTFLDWLDNKLSFLKQDFGKMFPKSIYAIQDLTDTQPYSTDLTVMMNSSTQAINDIDPDEWRERLLTFERAINPELDEMYNLIQSNIAQYNNYHEALTDWITRTGQRITLRIGNPDLDQVAAFWDDVLNQTEDITTREQFLTWLETLVDNYNEAGNNVNTALDNFFDRFPDHAWYAEDLDWDRGRVIMHRNARNVYSQINEIKEILKKVWGLLINIPTSNWPWE